MARVFRYQLQVVDDQIIEMPLGYNLLTVAPARDGYAIDLWAVVPEVAPTVQVTFHIAGTGHLLPAGKLDFVGTAVMGPLVWHVFQVIDPMSVKP